jgi:hypothetical protein
VRLQNWVRQKTWLTGGSSQFSGGYHKPLLWADLVHIGVVTFLLLYPF